jgi:hypothetical protein
MDLAGLSIAAAAGSITRRWYDIAVPGRVDGRTHATLDKDGTRMLSWELLDTTIIGPAPFEGVSLGARAPVGGRRRGCSDIAPLRTHFTRPR